MKKILLGLVCILLLVTGCGKTKDEGLNKNKEVIKDQTVGGLKFSDTSLKTVGTSSTYEVKVTNVSDKTIEKVTFDIVLKDKDNKEIVTLIGSIIKLEPNNSTMVISSVELDLSKAYKVEYKL